MAIIKKGILGGFSNKVGNVVGSSWKGISTMRSLPASYNDANSDAQKKQRTAFSYYSEMGSELLTSFIRPVLDPQAKRMSGYNLFVKQNLDAVANGKINFEEDLPIFSTGRLCEAYLLSAELDQDSSVLSLAWESNVDCTLGEESDSIYAFVFGIGNKVVWAGKVGSRGRPVSGAPGLYQGLQEISCPNFATEDLYYAIVCAYSPRLKEGSNQSKPKTISTT